MQVTLKSLYLELVDAVKNDKSELSLMTWLHKDGATISKVGGLNLRKIPASMLLSQPKKWPRYQS